MVVIETKKDQMEKEMDFVNQEKRITNTRVRLFEQFFVSQVALFFLYFL